MVRASLVLAVLVVQCTDFLWALPVTLDKALIYMGKSDKELKQFFSALSKHKFAKMEELYKKGVNNLTKLTYILGKLLKLNLDRDTKAFKLKEALLVQMQILQERMNTVFKSKEEAEQE